MKPTLKSLTVFGLTSCLTILQALPSQAQTSTLQMKPRTKAIKAMDLATPSYMIAPQKGVEIDMGYSRSEVRFEFEGLNYEASGNTGGSALSVALNRQIFLGVKVDYESATEKSTGAYQGTTIGATAKKDGAVDPAIFGGYRINSKSVSTMLGLNALISTGDKEVEYSSSGESKRNAKEGGSTISPKVAVFTNSKSSVIVGGELTYNIRQERKTQDKSSSGAVTTITTGGGNSTNATLFLESPQYRHSIGAAIAYNYIERSKTESSSSSSPSESDPTSAVAFLAYGNLKISNQVSLLPKFAYSHFIDNKIGGTRVDSQQAYLGGLDLRLTF